MEKNYLNIKRYLQKLPHTEIAQYHCDEDPSLRCLCLFTPNNATPSQCSITVLLLIASQYSVSKSSVVSDTAAMGPGVMWWMIPKVVLFPQFLVAVLFFELAANFCLELLNLAFRGSSKRHSLVSLFCHAGLPTHTDRWQYWPSIAPLWRPHRWSNRGTAGQHQTGCVKGVQRIHKIEIYN